MRRAPFRTLKSHTVCTTHEREPTSPAGARNRGGTDHGAGEIAWLTGSRAHGRNGGAVGDDGAHGGAGGRPHEQGRTAATTTAPNCQGTTPLGISGNWSCSFDDEFNGTSLNTSLWAPQLTATSLYVAGPDCYVNNPNTISESGGYLNLSVVKVPAGTQCIGSYRAAVRDRHGHHALAVHAGVRRLRGQREAAAGHRAGHPRDVLALPAEPHVRRVAGVGRDRLRRVLQPVPRLRDPLRPLQLHDQRPARLRGAATSTRRSSTRTGSTGPRPRSRCT